MTLSRLQPLSDLLNLLGCLLHYLNAGHNSLPHLSPTDGSMTPPPIKELKGWRIDAQVMAVVIGKLSQG